MPILDMKGPFPFTSREVDLRITRHQVGNYALGYLDKQRVFHVQYVGRSDTDVNARIKDHLQEERYNYFKFSYASSPKDAFEKECQNYHDFGESRKLDNDIHPDLPDNSPNWKCPVCGDLPI